MCRSVRSGSCCASVHFVSPCFLRVLFRSPSIFCIPVGTEWHCTRTRLNPSHPSQPEVDMPRCREIMISPPTATQLQSSDSVHVAGTGGRIFASQVEVSTQLVLCPSLMHALLLPSIGALPRPHLRRSHSCALAVSERESSRGTVM